MNAHLSRWGGRSAALHCQARHIHSSRGGGHHRAPQHKKKRDISTSFRRGPVPRPLITTPTPQQQPQQQQDEQQQQQQQQELLMGIPPPAAGAAGTTAVSPLAGLSLPRVAGTALEPVVAAAALAPMLATDFAAADDAEALLWGEGDALASMDRVLNGLVVAPLTPAPAAAAAAQQRSKQAHARKAAGGAAAGKQHGAAKQQAAPAAAAAAGRAHSSKAMQPGSSAAAAAAGPAVVVIHNEADYERELAAAAAAQQLLVVKVESSNNSLLQGGSDASLRFQTHTGLPTPLNTYLLNQGRQGLGSGFGGGSSAASGASALAGSTSTAEVLQSLGFPVGPSAASSSSSSSGSSSFGSAGGFVFSSSGSSGSEPFSPVHAWYRQLAAQYASAAAGTQRSSPIRFLSLQSDRPLAKAVARRLGASAGLSVVLVDAASGRRLQEVCGTKIEQELPNGLLYFGDSDPQGQRPSQRLQQLTSEAELDALRSSSDLAVVSFQVRAAPPCIRAFARLYAAAQQHAGGRAAGGPSLAYGVMDVDACPDGAALSSKLGLQQLPTYVLYRQGQEVARLSSSPDRRTLAAVLAQHVAAAAAATGKPAAAQQQGGAAPGAA